MTGKENTGLSGDTNLKAYLILYPCPNSLSLRIFFLGDRHLTWCVSN